jgi:hypothetical protein
MGRHKRFRHRKQVSVIFEISEHDNLRLVAAGQRQSVSEYIRDLVTNVLWGKSREEAPPKPPQPPDAAE